ncbi:MAG: chromate transporter [Thermotoga sp.]|nr:chromate transporter [Thermotoga sp.]
MVVRLFFLFLRISTLTIGGGYAMIPVMKWELEKSGLLTEKEFFRIVSTAQVIPGPIAFNTAILVGRKLSGLPGAVASGVAVVLPPFFAIVAVAEIIRSFSGISYVRSFLRGAYVAIVGLVGSVLFRLVKNQRWDLYRIFLVTLSALFLIFWRSFVIPMIVLLAFLLYLKEE